MKHRCEHRSRLQNRAIRESADVFICVHLCSSVADSFRRRRSAFRAPVVAALFGRCKNFSTAFASPLFSALWNFCNSPMNASTDRARFLRLASAMSRHISGEPDAMRVVSRKPLAHKRRLRFRMRRIQNQIRQRRRDDVRQMAGAADEQIVLLRRPVSKRARRAISRIVPTLRTAVGIGFFRRRQNADGVLKQIRARGGDAGFFRAGHRMTADKMRAGLLRRAIPVRARHRLSRCRRR